MHKFISIKKNAWFLYSFSFLVLILLALYIYRDDIFQSLQDPGIPFQTYDKPVAPDYSVPSSWLAIPDLKADIFDAKSPGDVFVVVPGVYRGGKHWAI